MSRFSQAGISLLMLVTASLLASGSASAATKVRSFVQNATGACQSALPVFDGQIRKRPLALQNEGTANAFVSCSFMGTTTGVGGIASIGIVFLGADNNTDDPVDLSCTLVDGYSGGTPKYFSQTRRLPANSSGNTFFWDQVDNGGSYFSWTANVSCNLPVGTGLSIIYTWYEEDVGN